MADSFDMSGVVSALTQSITFQANPMNQMGLEYMKEATATLAEDRKDRKPRRFRLWRELLAEELAKPAGEQDSAYVQKIREEIEQL